MNPEIEALLKKAYEKRKEVLKSVNFEIGRAMEMREGQIIIIENEKQKMNYLAFAIVGAVMSFTPNSLQNHLVILGLAILLINAFVFGYVAIALQRRSNIKHSEKSVEKIKECVKPYFDAYDEMIKEEQITEEGFKNMQNGFIEYLEKHKEMTDNLSIAKKTKLSIGLWYFGVYFLGLVILGVGIIQKYNWGCDDILCTYPMTIIFPML